MDPATGGDFLLCVADGDAIAEDGCSLRDSLEGDLVGLGDGLAQDETGVELGAGGESSFVDYDGNVIEGMDPDVSGLCAAHALNLLFVARKTIPHTILVLMTIDESFDDGVDTRTGVEDNDYQPPFKFTGKLNKLTINLKPAPVNAGDQRKKQEVMANVTIRLGW